MARWTLGLLGHLGAVVRSDFGFSARDTGGSARQGAQALRWGRARRAGAQVGAAGRHGARGAGERVGARDVGRLEPLACAAA
jgi:hypothetical protein